jgi:hypothetical protein
MEYLTKEDLYDIYGKPRNGKFSLVFVFIIIFVILALLIAFLITAGYITFKSPTDKTAT